MGGQGKKYPESNDTKNGDSVFSKTQFSLPPGDLPHPGIEPASPAL